jgi:dTDP-4-amino-4,6-dideoxygalactose transaminase
MKVPLLDLKAQYAPLRQDLLAAITRVCDSQRFILGPEVEALEGELARLLQVDHAVAVSSGTDALLLALMALNIGPGDEVITPAYSFLATAGSIARVGATPVFVDIDPPTFNVDPQRVAAAWTPRTRAVIPVHLFGQSAELDPLMALAHRHGVPVIEDAAQAIGGTYRGRMLGSIGAIGCFSFFPSKNLGAFGDAGLLTTGDAAIAKRVRMLRNHGQESKYRSVLIGGNFRMDALQAAVLRVKAPHLDAWTEARRLNAQRYRRMFDEAGLTDRIGLPIAAAERRHIYNQFVIRVPQRDALKEHLEAEGIGCEIYYPLAFHEQPCFAPLGYKPGDFPVAEQAARESLAIPIYGELTEVQQQTVVAAIAGFLNGRAESAAARPAGGRV